MILELSDGELNYDPDVRFKVEFLGENHLPYFEPVLTSFLQVFKQEAQEEPIPWSYNFPDVFDEDKGDTVTLTVDITEMEEIVTYLEEEEVGRSISIEDVSDPELPAG